RCVPRPIAMNRSQHLGVYEFVEGARLVAGQVHWNEAGQLAELLGLMWRARTQPGAQSLPNASEAHYSLRAYHGHVEARLKRVETALKGDPTAAVAGEFVRAQIRPGFEK